MSMKLVQIHEELSARGITRFQADEKNSKTQVGISLRLWGKWTGKRSAALLRPSCRPHTDYPNNDWGAVESTGSFKVRLSTIFLFVGLARPEENDLQEATIQKKWVILNPKWHLDTKIAFLKHGYRPYSNWEQKLWIMY